MSALSWVTRALKEAGIKYHRDIATSAVEAFVPVEGEQVRVTFLDFDDDLSIELRFGPFGDVVLQQLGGLRALFTDLDLIHDVDDNTLCVEYDVDAARVDDVFAPRIVNMILVVARMVGGTLLRMRQGASADDAFGALSETLDLSDLMALTGEDIAPPEGEVTEESIARTVALLAQLEKLEDPSEFLAEHLLEFDEDVMAVLSATLERAQAEGETGYTNYLLGLVALLNQFNAEAEPATIEAFLHMARLSGTTSVDEVRALAFEWPHMLETAFVDAIQEQAGTLEDELASRARELLGWLNQVRSAEPLLTAIAELTAFDTWEESRAFVKHEPLLQGRDALQLLDDLAATAEANGDDPSDWQEHREWLAAVQKRRRK